jgi:DNA polymerase-3 subunit beta
MSYEQDKPGGGAMLFTTSKENLNIAVSAVQRAINPKSIIPMYSCIKIEVRENLAVFTGAGLDVSIECSIPVQMEKEGSLLVNAKYFGDIVRRLPDIPITIEHTESMEMSIRYEKSVFTLRTASYDDYPSLDEFQGGLGFTISAELLKKLVRQSSFAASADVLKGVFTGLLWEVDGSELSLIGSDTHRLAWGKGKIDVTGQSADDEVKLSFIIPARIAQEVTRLIQDGVCQVNVSRNVVFFAFENIRVNCSVMEGSFPNFRQVIPSKFVTEIEIKNDVFRDAVDRISLFAAANDSSSTIAIEISEGLLSVHSQSDIGFGREEFSVEHEGEDIKINFNSRYITDVFKVIEGDHVEIKLSGPISAGIIREKADEDFVYLVLPVKV